MSDDEQVQAAFDAAVAGDVQPLVALFAPELEWRGVTRVAFGGDGRRVDTDLTRPGRSSKIGCRTSVPPRPLTLT